MDKWLNLDEGNKNIENNEMTSSEPSTSAIKIPRKRKYDESYLEFGFTSCNYDGIEKPLCLICKEVLAAESMKPSKLKRHLNTKHITHCKKPKEYFERLLKSSNQQKFRFENFITLNEKYLRASYEVSYLIAKNKKAYSIGENLVLPAAIKMSEIVHGKKYADEIRKIPLSNDTVSKRISEISEDQRQQLITRLKMRSKFAIQLDESTDITNLAQLLAYVRYIFEGSIHEEFLFCRSLEGHTRGEDIFVKVNEFFTDENLQWKDCVGICTDGAKAMVGEKIGFLAKVKENGNEHITFTHCMIHREALVAKKLSAELDVVLRDCVKVVNFIKSRALNSRLFSNLCKDMGSEYKSLLLHAEVRWLSRSQSLKRLLQLKDEVLLFLTEQKSDLANLFHNKLWLQKLYYMSDIFEKLNELNLSLQGKSCNIFVFKSKIDAFIKKITIWRTMAEKGSLEMFVATNEFLNENDEPGHQKDELLKVIIEHLRCLEKNFEKYFPSNFNSEELIWIVKPFGINVENITHLSLKSQEELAELSNDSGLKIDFNTKSLEDFWLGIAKEFPTISEIAINFLLPFSTTYLCEMTFSSLTAIKSKYRSNLKNIEEVLRPAVSTILPRFENIIKNKQAHPSH